MASGSDLRRFQKRPRLEEYVATTKEHGTNPHLKTQFFISVSIKGSLQHPVTTDYPNHLTPQPNQPPGPGMLLGYEAMNHSQLKKWCNGPQSPQQKSDSHAILGPSFPIFDLSQDKTPRHQECHSWVWKLISKAKEKGDKSWINMANLKLTEFLKSWIDVALPLPHPHV